MESVSGGYFSDDFSGREVYSFRADGAFSQTWLERHLNREVYLSDVAPRSVQYIRFEKKRSILIGVVN